MPTPLTLREYADYLVRVADDAGENAHRPLDEVRFVEANPLIERFALVASTDSAALRRESRAREYRPRG